MSEFKTIKIILDETSLINEVLNEIAREVGNVVSSSSIANPKIECVLTYPKGGEIEWANIGNYYHRQINGKTINFRGYLLHDEGGFHEECCSGFDDEPVVVILFKEPIWYDKRLMTEKKPNYLLFSDDDMYGGMYPCGVAYYFSKEDF